MSAACVTDCSAFRNTLVAFHAHPDDETLFTGGTLARAAAQGHRTVLVTATLGDRGLTGGSHPGLDVTRRGELQGACAALRVSRLVTLDYLDSGMQTDGPAPPGSLSAAPLAEVANRLRDLLEEEEADALTIYDAHGGYGHRDHVRIHDAGMLAARSVPGLRVFEATVPREALMRVVGLLNRCGVRPGGMTASDLAAAYRSKRDITHEINVRPWLGQKVTALRAHASQTTGGTDIRTVKLLTNPVIARAVLGREWFVEIESDATPTRKRGRSRDLFPVTG